MTFIMSDRELKCRAQMQPLFVLAFPLVSQAFLSAVISHNFDEKNVDVSELLRSA